MTEPRKIYTAIILVACIQISAMSQLGGKPQPPFVDNRDALKELAGKLRTLNTLLGEIDVGKLAVEYREGKVIEQRRRLALSDLKSSVINIDVYSKKGPTLDSTVSLVFDLRDLEGNLDALSSSLTGLMTTNDKASIDQGVVWAQRISDAYADLSNSTNVLQARARATLMMADTLVSSCKSK
jgi:hypothetical protein